METKQEHSISGSPVISLKKRMTYDHAGRLIKSEEQLNKTDWITVNELKYNEKGELISKKLYSADGTNFLQEVNYDYNIRGWMTFINNPENLGTDFFAVQLKYENGQTPQYNGNISEIIWADSAFTEQKGYTFTYDGINRLTTANYTDAQKYNTAYQYDFNGNILTLNRNGQTDELTNLYGNIDNLSYAYSGNQLLKVDDTEISENQENGFTDNGSFEDIEYLYDVNGNMIKDFNKDIDSVSYNHLNLPERIEVSGNGSLNIIYYTYDAAGIKLNKYADYSNGYDKTTDYVGNFIYENDQLKYILTDYGKIIVDSITPDTFFTRQYNLTDHLGNVRVTFNVKSDSTADIVQEDSYYPYGMEMSGLSYLAGDDDSRNLYLFGNKELQTDFELDWLDFHARFYDAQLGRWHVQDELMEEHYDWTPYHYVRGNPINRIDPDGMSDMGITKTVVDPNNRVIFHDPNDPDKGIYKSDNYTYNGESTDNMKYLGQEDPNQNYKVGYKVVQGKQKNWIAYDDGFKQSGQITPDYTFETLFIPAFGFIRVLKIGKWVYKLVPKKGGGYVLKFLGLADDAAKYSGPGVYNLATTTGRYIGQSKSLFGRLVQHFAKGGKLSNSHLKQGAYYLMPGSSKLQREVYEQYIINKLGIGNLKNIRNPMGRRMDTYKSMIDDVIKQFNLPK